MRVALISDLHGNEVALDAVLAAAAEERVDQFICLGDVATLGPSPHRVIQRLMALHCPCILGNHDAFLLDADLIEKYTDAEAVVQSVNWCRQQLSAEELDFIRGMKESCTVNLTSGVLLSAFHGSPRSITEDLLATTEAGTLQEALGSCNATVVAVGHTHVQMLRQHRGTLLVNPGSVGMPFKEYVAGRAPTVLGHAEYATIDATQGQVSVSLHRVALDRNALIAALRSSDVPIKEDLIAQYSA